MKTSTSKLSTMAESYSTSRKAEITLKMPELHVTAQISAPFHVKTKKSNYNVIVDRDLLQELGIQLDFQNSFIEWRNVNIPIKPIDCKMRTHFTIQESKNVSNPTKRIKKILDANDKKVNF